jgi:seryl-tRNA synthetase
MLDIQLIREHPDRVRAAISSKRIGRPEVVDELLAVDNAWRESSTALQDLKTDLNERGKRIGDLMRGKRLEEAESLKTENARVKAQIGDHEAGVRMLRDRRHALMLEVPNLPHESVPVGSTPADNKEVDSWSPPSDAVSRHPRPHWEIFDEFPAERGLVDFERGAKVTGAGFPFYRGKGARLQRALVNFFLDEAVKAGYTELQAPILVNAASATATGQLPDKEDQMYEVTRDGLYAIPTAEVPLTNFLRDETLSEADLPIRFCGYTPCFRREAGSYGKDVRGLNRLHQFDKVELVQFVTPESSYDALEEMRAHAEGLLKMLELPYRRLLMCTADMGFTQSKKYDLEVWSAGQQRWLEVSSISNFEAFQSRRANIRYRAGSDGKPHFVHTLNGSGLALPRVVSAIIENRRDASGDIEMPGILRGVGKDGIRYLDFDKIEGDFE